MLLEKGIKNQVSLSSLPFPPRTLSLPSPSSELAVLTHSTKQVLYSSNSTNRSLLSFTTN